MKEQRGPEGNFERGLLDELKSVVAERGAEQDVASEPATSRSARRRAPRLALAAIAALATAAVVLVFNSGGGNTPKVFAVEPQEGGGVRIKVYSLKDASGLEKALEAAGIRAQVTWLPPGMFCREPHFTPSTVKPPGGGSMGGFNGEGPGALTISVGSHRSLSDINLDPKAFRPDQSVILSGSAKPYNGDPEGGYEARFAVAEGPVEPCEPVAAPASSIGSIRLPRGTEAAPEGGAAVAEASDAPAEAPPAPGQLLYSKTKVVELQGWLPSGPGTGSRSDPRYFTAHIPGNYPNAPAALVPTIKEVWMAPDGATQVRETLGRIDFFSSDDQRRWEGAGSPPPFSYDPQEHDVSRDGSGRLVKEFESRFWRRRPFANVPKLSKAPTEPEALRLAIENRLGDSSPTEPSPAGSHIGSVTAERLLEILGEPITSAALRAAAINALAEMPGIGLERSVVDVAGRRGDAITWVRERGFGRELIFDPRTSKVLAQAEVIFDAKAAGYPGIPDDTPFRETAYLRSGVVDSTHERPTRSGHR